MTSHPIQLPPPSPGRIVDGILQALSLVIGVAGIAVVAIGLFRFFPGTNAIVQPVETAAVATTVAPAPATTVAPVTETTVLTETTVAPATTVAPTTDTTLAAAPEPVVTPPPPPGVEVLGVQAPMLPYRVERGDTLSIIGERFGVEWERLAEINSMPNPDVLGIGTVLLIPDQEIAVSGVPGLLATNPDKVALVALFDQWAVEYEVPAELVMSVAWLETEWDGTRVSATGEVGIGQLTPELYGWISTNLIGEPLDPTVASDGIRAVAAYLGWLLSETEGDTSAALASYHQGLLSQRDIGWRQDTVQYISQVLALRPIFDPRSIIS